MNKLLIILLFAVFFSGMSFASENSTFNKLQDNNKALFNFKSSGESNIKDFECEKYSLTTRSSKNLIELGKVLTFLGIGAFALSATTIALGFVTAISALYLSGAIETLAAIWYHSIRWGMLLHSLNTSISVMALSTATVCLWVIGSLTLMMTVLLIPGIVLWAVGSSKTSKIVSMNNDSMGYTIKI